MNKFKNKTAIVTGGGSGIGKAIASDLVKHGATVVITDINQERIDEVVSELKQRNNKCSRVFASGFVLGWSNVLKIVKSPNLAAL